MARFDGSMSVNGAPTAAFWAVSRDGRLRTLLRSKYSNRFEPSECCYQAISRFDHWSLSETAIFHTTTEISLPLQCLVIGGSLHHLDVPVALDAHRLHVSLFEFRKWTDRKVAYKVKVLPVATVVDHLVEVPVTGSA